MSSERSRLIVRAAGPPPPHLSGMLGSFYKALVLLNFLNEMGAHALLGGFLFFSVLPFVVCVHISFCVERLAWRSLTLRASVLPSPSPFAPFPAISRLERCGTVQWGSSSLKSLRRVRSELRSAWPASRRREPLLSLGAGTR